MRFIFARGPLRHAVDPLGEQKKQQPEATQHSEQGYQRGQKVRKTDSGKIDSLHLTNRFLS